ncbi:SDR family NAD(P)-dependent oxidoreductase [Arthrobacter oryzae]|uniref:SDR family NAD(P)-dependent oxidoreductase n=1 Tax=Arthrobacter oryzae TaxID=409290 RepID=UPI0028662328|nr:SDR family NAD(P)-dependent oxidoreductase [Arthrobacter oryzae]MDR6508361.1 3-oxoacyl-[acyl-carrier protein] reductase [Arthrobacter oryzae]
MNDYAELLTERLKGRRIIITGAASGIGRSTAQLFAREGAAVGLLDRDKEKLLVAAEEIGGSAFPVDITDDEAVASVIKEAAATLSGIDGVVNAAGIMFRGHAVDVSTQDWRKVIDINLTGTYNVVRSCIPWLLQETSATVVTIASAAGLLPNSPGYTAYAASKGGVIALTKALAAELAPKVRANTVCPGMVDTAMAEGHRGNVGNYALNRLADPVEIARAILFLTSPESSYVTGAALATDGGRSFH